MIFKKPEKYNPKMYLLFLLVLFASVSIRAQSGYLVHGFDIIPQSSYTNPAYISDSNRVVGFPFLSSISSSAYSTGFTFDELFNTQSGSDSLYLNLGNVVGEPGGINYIAGAVENDLLHLGFKIKKSYLTLGAKHRALFRGFYVNDLVEIMWYGNSSSLNREIDISQSRIFSDHFISYYLGLAFPIADRVIIGARINLNRGMSNVSTVYNDTRLLTEENNTSAYSLHAKTHFLVNTSGLTWDQEGKGFNPFKYYYNFSNIGLSLDLGIDVKITEQVHVNMSFIDFGYINWNSNLQSYQSKYDSIRFDGIYVDDEVEDNGIMSVYIDSLESILQVTELTEAYRSELPARLMAGAEYYTANRLNRVSFLFSGRFWEDYFEPSFTLGFDKTVASYFAFKVSYTYHLYAPFNLGAGVVFNAGPLQIYFLSDNVLSVVNYRNQHYINFHCGINFIMGD